jgi:phospholipase/carboxylesterase
MKLRSIELAPRQPGLSRTLVLLHGYGADEHDLLPIGHELDPRLRVVSLQAPLSMGGTQRSWYSLRQEGRGLSFDEAEAREAALLAAEAVAEIGEQHGPGGPKPFLLGFSQGASIALAVALTRPALCAGVLSLSGVPARLEPQDLAAPAALRGFPVFAAHGTHDPVLPIEMGRANRAELGRLGCEVFWREYPMGHMVLPEELADARSWLLPRL